MKNFICLPLLLVCVSAYPQQKSLQAIKTSQAPKIDGNLDDAAWGNAPILTDFIQNFPTYGLPVSRKT
ncbi:MAG: hypothetical protein AAB221_08020, partial [Bacteroidota bacterium]